MPATTGERLIGTVLTDIAPNHLSRYEWAIRLLKRELKPGARVLDAACGVAYGAMMIADAGFEVVAVDRDDEAKDYSKYFKHRNVEFRQQDIMAGIEGEFDAAVSIETIEHVDAPDWIAQLHEKTPLIIGTVPNEDVVPFAPGRYKFHLRHYTKDDIRQLFKHWELSDWATQHGKWDRYEMIPGTDGMTLGFLARRK